MSLDKRYHLDAPKIKRTHCWAQQPNRYEMSCPICDGTNITWSEFEKHLWCYDCEKDVYITIYHSGIFSGPISTSVAQILGISFDRINIETGDIVRFGEDDDSYNKTWVYDASLSAFEKEEFDAFADALNKNKEE